MPWQQRSCAEQAHARRRGSVYTLRRCRSTAHAPNHGARVRAGCDPLHRQMRITRGIGRQASARGRRCRTKCNPVEALAFLLFQEVIRRRRRCRARADAGRCVDVVLVRRREWARVHFS